MKHPWRRIFRPRQAKTKMGDRDLRFFVERTIYTAEFFERCEDLAMLECHEIEERDLTRQEPDPYFIEAPHASEQCLPVQWLFV